MAPFVAPPGFDPKFDSQYHYIPTGWVCLLFTVLFGLSAALHLAEAIKFRLWWLLPTAVLGGIGETLGWSARYWSSLNDGTLDTPFLIQISSTIIAPTPFLAAYFILFGRLIGVLGPQYSRLSQRRYAIIFCTADVVALVIQAVGGGMASGATNPNIGGNIMLAGIIAQLISLVIFISLATEFLFRITTNRPFLRDGVQSFELNSSDSQGAGPSGKPENNRYLTWQPRIRMLLGGMAFSILCLFIRAIYRTIELSDGWNGRIISTQVYFNVLDGAMVLLAMWTLNIFHPGFLLRE